jgi:hypothetical protein
LLLDEVAADPSEEAISLELALDELPGELPSPWEIEPDEPLLPDPLPLVSPPLELLVNVEGGAPLPGSPVEAAAQCARTQARPRATRADRRVDVIRGPHRGRSKSPSWSDSRDFARIKLVGSH